MRYDRYEAKEAAREKVRGVWAAIITPFTENGDVDVQGLHDNVVSSVEDFGVSGVFCAGAQGEFWSLTLDERKLVVETVVEAARGRCGVMAHTGHHSVRETIALTLHAQEVGADFAATFTPYYPLTQEPGLLAWFTELTDNTDIPLWLIDTGLAGPWMSLDLIDELANIPNVCGIKVHRNETTYEELFNRVGDRILISDPSESRWLDLIRFGQQAFMSSPTPLLLQPGGTKPMVRYTEAAQAGRWDEAREIAATMQPLREVYAEQIRRDKEIGRPPTSWVKIWSGRIGLASGPLRAPAWISDEEVADLNARLDEALSKVPVGV